MHAATVEARLEELGMLLSLSRPEVLNDIPYLDSLLRMIMYRPDKPGRLFASKPEDCAWAADFWAGTASVIATAGSPP